MRIKNINTYHLQHKLKEPFGFSQWWYQSRAVMLIEIETDSGVSGWGEAYGPAAVTKAIVDHYFKPLLLGKNPLEIESLWEFMYRRSLDYGRKGVMIAAISAVDIALWDIKGKTEKKPVCQLLSNSGKALLKEVPAYVSGMYFVKRDNLSQYLATEAKGYVGQGFPGMKMKVGLELGQDIRNVEAVRQAIGDNIHLMVDANHYYSCESAVTIGKKLELFNITWFEEPVSPDDYEGYKDVRERLNILIAGGECEFTRYGFAQLIGSKCVDIVQPDPCAAGGISETMKIAKIVDQCDGKMVFHTWGSAIALAVSLHLNAGLFSQVSFRESKFPWPWLELDRTENIFREKLLEEPIKIQKGMVNVPQGYGLGIEINRDILDKYKVT